MRKIVLAVLACLALPASAQHLLTLDSCRTLALRNNKQLIATRKSKEVAYNTRKAMRTNYLPKVDALGGYQYTSKEISLLNKRTKQTLSSLGTSSVASVTNLLTSLVQSGAVSQEEAQQLGGLLSKASGVFEQGGNAIGQRLVDAFKTDTKNFWSGTVMARQPLYMGGAIIAANKMADIGEKMAANNEDLVTQNTLYSIDQTYWTTVSLRQKEKLAYSYRDLVKKLDDDVKKMIAQGVATKADGLRVDVKVNEAEMQIVQVEDGLVLAKMLLCQLCGLPLEEDIMLADENKNTLDTDAYGMLAPQDSTYDERPEVRLFQNAVEMSEQNTKLVLAQYLPHVLLTGGYMISNPNLWDGFNRRFSGVWNVGVTLTVPVWNWMESKYKIRGSKATTTISRLNLADLEEKIHLQATQARFKIKEAYKRLNMAKSNLNSADENLRCANVGFKEGVMDVTDVMAAQTAWQKAQSDKIDAEVDVKLSQVELQKALGRLR